MIRRYLIPVALGLVLVTVSALWFSGASITSAFNQSAAASTPAALVDEPAPAGGIGNTRSNIEQVYGQPTGLTGTMIGYKNGQDAATYTHDRATSLLVSFPGQDQLTLQAAHSRIQSLLPTDVSFVGTLSVGSNRTAEIYNSSRLAKYVPSTDPKVPAGVIAVVYQTDAQGHVTQALLNVGGLPPSASRAGA